MKISHSDLLYAEIKAILLEARQSVYHAVNSAMVIAYWEIGKRIVEFEQGGKKRADYGESLLVGLSKKLTSDFGKGFALASLKNYRQFYLTFSESQKGSAAGSLLIENKKNKKSSALRSQSAKIIAIQKSHALRSELSWTHYRLLMRVENVFARNYYQEEAIAQNWSTRALERQINSFY